MTRIRFLRSLMVAGGVCALLAGTAVTTQAQQYDAPQPSNQPQAYANADQVPGRVARLAYLSGQVQFAPAGGDDWGSVDVNRPMVIGDRLLTGDNGRAVLELGDASVRIAHGSAFDFLNLSQDNVQIELSQGTLNLAVRQMQSGENFEVDTPTIAFVASQPGVYRIDDDPSGTGSMVSVFQGAGVVYGENGVSRQVAAGTSYRFNDSTLANVDVNGLPQPDDFDRFCDTRDQNYQHYAQQEQQYVPPEMIGGDQLYQYGQWDNTPEYGNVWYPNTVPTGWAPYRYGHWAWIDPWGWTWVDDQPWGFAPFHYGRWVYASNRWGWLPGPVNVRPVYAPALVAFIGGSGLSVSLHIGGGGPVGWFPLGPRDVYMPWFHASRNYFTRVNVTNIRNVYVNKTVINNFYSDYRAGRRPPRGRDAYAYRHLAGAVTAVPRNVFTGARPVHPAVLKLDRKQLTGAEVAYHPGVNPGKASLGLRHVTARPAVLHGREPFAKPVVARHQPAPRPVSFATREKVIASQHGRPLTASQVQNLRKAHPAPASQARRVKLVPTARAGAAANPAHGARQGATPVHPVTNPGPRDLSAHGAGTQKPSFKNTVHPIPAGRQPFKNTVHPIRAPINPIGKEPLRPGELPSARFHHPERSAGLPRAAVIRPASESQRKNPAAGRLPVVKPMERSPQSLGTGTAQQRQAAVKAQQRAHTQSLQQRNQAKQQAQAQQAQRQQQVQEQAQQRARTQQVEQQRVRAQQAQQQAQQRARAQQAQKQQQAQQRQHAEQVEQQRVRAQQAQQQAQQRARAQQAQQQVQQRQHAQQVEQQRVRAQQAQQQRSREQAMQRQQQMQSQQRQREQVVQRQQQVRQREMQRAPQPRQQRPPERREPKSKKHPPPSSGNH